MTLIVAERVVPLGLFNDAGLGRAINQTVLVWGLFGLLVRREGPQLGRRTGAAVESPS